MPAAAYCEPDQPGIIRKIEKKGVETTLKTVFAGSRMDFCGGRVPDGKTGDGERSVRKPRPFLLCDVQGGPKK